MESGAPSPQLEQEMGSNILRGLDCWGRSGSGGGGLALADMVGHLDVGALWRGAGSQWGRHHRDKGPPPTCPVASLLAWRGGTINLRLEQLKRSRTGVTELFESVSAAEGPALSP